MHPRGTWDDELLGVEEVARRCGVEPTAVARWCRQGCLPCLKLGASWRIRCSALDAFRRRAEHPPTLAAHLQAFLTVPDQVLAVVEDATRLTRLAAAFCQVAAATDGLLLKLYDPHAASPRALREALAHQGLDAERLEAAGRLRWSPMTDPDAGIATLRQCLADAVDEERTVWATINRTEGMDLAAALRQQAELATLVAAHPLVVMTGVVAPGVDAWPTAHDQWRLVGALRGVVRYSQARLILDRVVAPPAG